MQGDKEENLARKTRSAHSIRAGKFDNSAMFTSTQT
jgi:hypothetical protein